MKLKNYTKKVIIEVDHYHLETLIREIYGQDYEIMPYEEVGSSQYAATYNIDVKKSKLDEYDLSRIEKLKTGNPESYSLRAIMTDMCNREIIEDGSYVIGVNW